MKQYISKDDYLKMFDRSVVLSSKEPCEGGHYYSIVSDKNSRVLGIGYLLYRTERIQKCRDCGYVEKMIFYRNPPL